MAASAASILERLDQEDKEKVSYFIRLLLNKSKYQQLKKEIADRREEIPIRYGNVINRPHQ